MMIVDNLSCWKRRTFIYIQMTTCERWKWPIKGSWRYSRSDGQEKLKLCNCWYFDDEKKRTAISFLNLLSFRVTYIFFECFLFFFLCVLRSTVCLFSTFSSLLPNLAALVSNRSCLTVVFHTAIVIKPIELSSSDGNADRCTPKFF